LPIFNFGGGEHPKCRAKGLNPPLGPTLSMK
jgi:hypothetical protein